MIVMFKLIFISIFLFDLLSFGESRKIIFNNEYARAFSGNSSVMKLKYFSFSKYNRTAKVANVEFEFFSNKPYFGPIDILCSFSIFKSNEYKKTPISFGVKLCDILGTTKYDIPSILSNSSVKTCPLKTGHHYIYNILLTSNGWPKSLPTGRYLMELRFLYKSYLLVTIEWMLEIIRV